MIRFESENMIFKLLILIYRVDNTRKSKFIKKHLKKFIDEKIFFVMASKKTKTKVET